MQKIAFVLGPSKGLMVFLSLLFLSAAAMVLWISIPYWVKTFGIALLFLYGWRLWNLHAKRISKKSIVYIWQDTEGRWGCQTREGHAALGRLQGDSFKSIGFLIVRLQFQHRALSILIPADALTMNEYKILYTRFQIFSSPE